MGNHTMVTTKESSVFDLFDPIAVTDGGGTGQKPHHAAAFDPETAPSPPKKQCVTPAPSPTKPGPGDELVPRTEGFWVSFGELERTCDSPPKQTTLDEECRDGVSPSRCALDADPTEGPVINLDDLPDGDLAAFCRMVEGTLPSPTKSEQSAPSVTTAGDHETPRSWSLTSGVSTSSGGGGTVCPKSPAREGLAGSVTEESRLSVPGAPSRSDRPPMSLGDVNSEDCGGFSKAWDA